MKLGKFNIDVLDTGLFYLDGGAMFGIVPKALWSKAYNAGDEHNRIPLTARLMLIRWDNKTLLVDTGNGTKLDIKIAQRYGIDLEKSSVDLALKPLNLTTDDITDVLLTHLHFDHSGGATSIVNNEIVPTFKNAKYYVQKEHYNWAIHPTEKDRASFFNENYVPLKEMGLLEFTEGAGSIFQGIDVVPVHGHTSFMQMVKIHDAEESALFCADLCPTSAHIPVPFVMGYDNFPLTAIEEKKQLLPKVFEENTILIFEHDAFKQACRLEKTDKGLAAGTEIIITQ